jgi:hypothetical protein
MNRESEMNAILSAIILDEDVDILEAKKLLLFLNNEVLRALKIALYGLKNSVFFASVAKGVKAQIEATKFEISLVRDYINKLEKCSV